MAIVVPHAVPPSYAEGRRWLLDKAFATAFNSDCWLRLYQNDYTPVEGSVAGDFTQADFPGYGAMQLSKWGWFPAQTSGGVTSKAYSGNSTFIANAACAQTIYGFYVTSDATGVLLWAERFAAPSLVQYYGASGVGDRVSIDILLRLDS